MKKSLSLILALAMVFSMFASVAFAAESPKTTQEKYDALKAIGIFEGDDTGANLTGSMERAQLAKIVAKVEGLTPDAAANKYTDVAASHWAAGFIGAVTKAGIFEGKEAGKFDPEGKVSLQELAKVLVLVAGLKEDTTAVAGKVDDWAKGYVAAAAKLGLVKSDYTVDANRGEFVDVTFGVVDAIKTNLTVKSVKAIDANNVEFTLSNGAVVAQKLDTALVANKETEVKVTFLGKELTGKVTLSATLEVTKAEAVGAKTVKVTFNGAVDTTKAVATLKTGTTVQATTPTWNADKNELTLTSTVSLAAADYTVTVSGVDLATGKDTATLTVAPERIDSIVVADNAFRDATTTTTVNVTFKVLNQYGEDVTANYGTDKFVVTSNVGDLSGTAPYHPADKGKITLTNVASDKTSTVVTVLDGTFAKYAAKTVNIAGVRSVGEVTLNSVILPTDKTAYSSATEYEVSYTAKDQFGTEMKLTTADLSKLTFISSNATVFDNTATVDNDGVTAYKAVRVDDSNNKLYFKFKTFDGPKSVDISAYANGTGKGSKVTLNVNGTSQVSEPTLVAPTARFGLGDTYKVELQVKDQYGVAMTNDKIAAAYTASPSKLTVISGNQSVFTVSNVIADSDGKAYVTVTGVGKGSAVLTVTVNGTSKSTTQTLTVVDAKVAASMTLVPDVTSAVYLRDNGVDKSGKVTLKATFKDQYGDDFAPVSGASTVTLGLDAANFVVAADGSAIPATIDAYVLKNTGLALKPVAADKAMKLTAKLYKNTTTTDANLVDTRDVSFTSVKSDAALTYSIDTIPTLYSGTKYRSVGSDPFLKTVTLIAKDAAGNKVAIDQSLITNIRAVDSSLLVVENHTVKAAGDKVADTFLNVDFTKANSLLDHAQVAIKISNEAPAVASLTGKWNADAKTAVTITDGTDLLTSNLYTDVAGVDNLWFEVKDQYGSNALNKEAVVYFKDKTGYTALSTNGSTVKYTFSKTTADNNKVAVQAVLADKIYNVDVTVK